MRFRQFALLLAASAGLCAPAVAADRPDVLSAMFAWWNDSMHRHVPFEEKGFARFFASDAVLRIDGVAVASGLGAVTAHFRAIQDSGAEVEIVLPFAGKMVSASRIYTYHVIRSRRNGKARCMLAAGHADLARGRIREISLVRTVVRPGSSPAAQSCWPET